MSPGNHLYAIFIGGQVYLLHVPQTTLNDLKTDYIALEWHSRESWFDSGRFRHKSGAGTISVPAFLRAEIKALPGSPLTDYLFSLFCSWNNYVIICFASNPSLQQNIGHRRPIPMLPDLPAQSCYPLGKALPETLYGLESCSIICAFKPLDPMPINLITEEARCFVRTDMDYGILGYNIFRRIAKKNGTMIM